MPSLLADGERVAVFYLEVLDGFMGAVNDGEMLLIKAPRTF
jgi:hypothetical protein